MTLKGLSLLLGGWGSKLGREKSTLMILSALIWQYKIHTYLCTNQQIHDILKERKIFKVIRKSAIEVEELRWEMWKLSQLDLSLARGYFMHKYVQHMPIAMCYRQEYIYFANAKLSLSSRLSLCDAPPLGNRREDLQLETSRENLWPCRSSRFFLGRDNLILTAKKTKNEGYYYLKNKCLIQVSTLSLKVPNPLSD